MDTRHKTPRNTYTHSPSHLLLCCLLMHALLSGERHLHEPPSEHILILAKDAHMEPLLSIRGTNRRGTSTQLLFATLTRNQHHSLSLSPHKWYTPSGQGHPLEKNSKLKIKLLTRTHSHTHTHTRNHCCHHAAKMAAHISNVLVCSPHRWASVRLMWKKQHCLPLSLLG